MRRILGRQFLRTCRRRLSTTQARTQQQKQALPSSADVVVIGGGSIGCNTLYHLTKLGVTNAVLLERDKLTSGTTWHTAGLLWRIRPSEIDIALVDRTRELNTGLLEAETGMHTGWQENGGLFLATCPERLTEAKRFHGMARAMGIECNMVTRAEIKDIHPLLNVEDVLGGIYTPGDGLLDPSAFMNALAKASTQAGAKVIENCRVTHIDTVEVGHNDQSRVTKVVTDQGTIETQAVVCCAGAWSDKLGNMVGDTVPLVPFKHCYVITDSIPDIGLLPNTRDPDRSVYLRLQGKAMEVGGFERDAEPIPDLAEDFAFSLYDFPWDQFEECFNAATHRFPVLERVGIKKELCGPESFTPDHIPLLGASPNVRGMFYGCGMNSQGMQYGSGYGQQLASWVVNGRPELDMHQWDIRRFAPQVLSNKKWMVDRSSEGVKDNYAVHFHFDQYLAERCQITDPLFEPLLAQGAVFEDVGGMERPAWFSPDGKPSPFKEYAPTGDPPVYEDPSYLYSERLKQGRTFEWPGYMDAIKEECIGARTRVALFNMTSFGKFFISGPDAEAAADYVFTNDMRKPVGSTIYTLMLNKQGLIENDLTVSVIDNTGPLDLQPELSETAFYVVAGAGSRHHALGHIRDVIADGGFNAQVLDFTDDLCLLSLQGPKSREILRSVVVRRDVQKILPMYSNLVINVAGTHCRVLRVSFVGELGYELHVPRDEAHQVYQAIMEAGQDVGIVNAGFRALHSLSLEKGYHIWGNDVRMSDTPQEVGLGFAVKTYLDTDFHGREALEKRKKAARKNQLAYVQLLENVPVWGTEPVYRNKKFCGLIRRGDYAHHLDCPVAHAMLESSERIGPNFIKDGIFEVEVAGKRVPAKLTKRSPFDPESKRLQGIYE